MENVVATFIGHVLLLVSVDENSIGCRSYIAVDMVMDFSRKCQNEHLKVESIFRLDLN